MAAITPTELKSLQELCAEKFKENPNPLLKKFIEEKILNYHYLCEAYSDDYLKLASKFLVSKLPPNACILTTGSDGRKEKVCGKESPVEIVLYAENEEELKELSKQLAALTKGQALFFQKGLDLRTKDKSLLEMLNKVIPSRALHSQFLKGQEKEYQKYLKQAVNQIKEISIKDLANFRQNFCNPSQNDLKKCLENKSKDSVDLENKVILYDGGFKKRATKYIALRAVQYNLDLSICKHIQSIDEQTSVEFLKRMPSTTFELIQFLYDEKVIQSITLENVQTLQKSYNLCLIYLHLMQNLFEASHKEIKLTLSDENIKELRLALTNIQTILKKIKPTEFEPIKAK
jgi:hypothetical protein